MSLKSTEVLVGLCLGQKWPSSFHLFLEFCHNITSTWWKGITRIDSWGWKLLKHINLDFTGLIELLSLCGGTLLQSSYMANPHYSIFWLDYLFVKFLVSWVVFTLFFPGLIIGVILHDFLRIMTFLFRYFLPLNRILSFSLKIEVFTHATWTILIILVLIQQLPNSYSIVVCWRWTTFGILYLANCRWWATLRSTFLAIGWRRASLGSPTLVIYRRRTTLGCFDLHQIGLGWWGRLLESLLSLSNLSLVHQHGLKRSSSC